MAGTAASRSIASPPPLKRWGTRVPALQLAILITAVCSLVWWVHSLSLSSTALYVDDYPYLINNALVLNPSWESARRFVTEVLNPSTVRGYYQPMTMISLMLDVAAGGGPENLQPFHRTNILLHVANVLLVAVILRRLFGGVVPAAMVAMLFGLHPLVVEPLAWIADRKTLLASTFALLAIYFYLRWLRWNAALGEWKTECEEFRAKGRAVYLGMLAAFALSVLSKPTAAMLPVALLLFDVWPLRRLTPWPIGRIDRRVLIEKLPLFTILVAAGGIAFLSQKTALDSAEVGETEPATFLLALCHNFGFYFRKIVWPVSLTPHYPFPDTIAMSEPAVALGVVLTAPMLLGCLIAFRWTRAPLVGFLAFVVLLLPTLSIIKQTITLTSDKYVYFPAIALLIVACGGLTLLWNRRGTSNRMVRTAMVAVVGALAVGESLASREQHRRWRSSEALYQWVVQQAPRSSFAWFGQGHFYYSAGRLEEARGALEEAVRLRPQNSAAWNDLGLVLADLGRFDEAVAAYSHAIAAADRKDADALTNLGNALRALGRRDEAEAALRDAVRIANKPEGISGLANLLAETGRLEEARAMFAELASREPNRSDVLNNYGGVLRRMGQMQEAEGLFERAMEIDPSSAAIRYNYGSTLLDLGKAGEAVAQLVEGARLAPGDVRVIAKLAKAFAAAGRHEEAIRACDEALRLQPDHVEMKNLRESLQRVAP